MKSGTLPLVKRIFDRLQTSGLAGGFDYTVYTDCTVPTNRGMPSEVATTNTKGRSRHISTGFAPGASAHFRSTMASV